MERERLEKFIEEEILAEENSDYDSIEEFLGDEEDFSDYTSVEDFFDGDIHNFDSFDSFEKKDEKNTRLFQGALIFINAVLIAIFLYMNEYVYFPTERELLDDNLFSGNDLITSEAELDNIISVLESELGVSIPEEYEDEYLLLDAVMKNPNLNDYERKFIYNYIDLIKDNPYLDKEASYRALLNVDILHKKRPLGYDKSINGIYIYDIVNIGIFEDDEEQSVLAHEVIHCIYDNDKTVNLPNYFKEGMTEMLTNEYFSDNPYVELKTYPFEIAAVKMLCELTSPDTVLKAFSYGDMSIIAQGIANVTGKYDDAVYALDMLDYAFRGYNDELEEGEEKLDYFGAIEGFCLTFRECINLKYDNDESNWISYCYNEILLMNIFNADSYDKYVDDLEEFGSDRRAYFSSKLKQKAVVEAIVDKIDNDEDKGNSVKILEK